MENEQAYQQKIVALKKYPVSAARETHLGFICAVG